eukprot:1651714-Heterocapsa_arctica.AAC.1
MWLCPDCTWRWVCRLRALPPRRPPRSSAVSEHQDATALSCLPGAGDLRTPPRVPLRRLTRLLLR